MEKFGFPQFMQVMGAVYFGSLISRLFGLQTGNIVTVDSSIGMHWDWSALAIIAALAAYSLWRDFER